MAIDDFGTGFSRPSHFAEPSADRLNIDLSITQLPSTRAMNRLSPVSLSAAQPHKAASPSAAARCNQGLVGDAGHVGRSLAQAEQRGAIDVKGNGEMRTWFLNGRNR